MNVRIARQDGVATVTLDRPDKLNALTEEMYDALIAGFAELAADDGVRAVVLTGAGRAFCAGSDVAGMVNRDLAAGRQRMHKRARLAMAVAGLEKPVIAAVRGAAVGIGFSLAMACDLIVASETARFVQAFKNLGLVPDGGSVFFLTRLVGVARAKELVFTARPLGAAEAHEWGIVSRVVPDAELEGATGALAAELAGSATFALGLAKKMFQSMSVPSLEMLLETENLAANAAKLTEDHAEGLAAFREKRKPQFRGR